MKKFYFMMATVLTVSLLTAQTSNVTFRVDMTGLTVSPDSVHIAGNFQSDAGFPSDWDPAATTMKNSTGNIYEVQVNLPDGIYEYKFINDDDWPGVESVPSLSQVGYSGNDNRWILVQGDTVLPAVQFGGDAPVNMKAVSFIVNLENEGTVQDTVSVAGNFQGWSPGTTRMALLDSSSDRFHYIHYDSTGANLEWKFVNGNAWGQEETVPSTCATSGGNRFYNGMGDTIYDVCFAQCKACFIPDTFDLTLNVDMNATCGFDPASDSVDIAGPFNGWPGSPALNHLLSDPDGDGIYSITVRAISPQFTYKARFIKNGNVNWEGGGNNNVMISSDTTLMERCFGFDQLGACAPKPAPADITFEVDMSNYSGSVSLSDVYVMGDFTDPNWQGGAIKMTASTTNPGFFETTVQDVCPGKISYKFVVNDPSTGTNGVDFQEEDFSSAQDTSCLEPSGVGNFNRIFIRPNAQPQVLNAPWQECNTVGLSESALNALIEVYPNPMDDIATVTLPQNTTFELSISDITGRVMVSEMGISNTYNLDMSNLPAGIYLLNLTSDEGTAVTRKLIVE